MGRRMKPVPQDPVLEGQLEAMEEETERELAERTAEDARVNFRWGREQLAFVKRAAGVMGIPYQTYIKQAAFRQAAEDLQLMEAARSRG